MEATLAEEWASLEGYGWWSGAWTSGEASYLDELGQFGVAVAKGLR
jgi:hypothetical protein